MRTFIACLAVVFLAVFASPAPGDVFHLPSGQTSLEFVKVGNSGNLPDTRYYSGGFGAVPYEYRVGRFEVTVAQYTEFLNAVAAQSDPFGLYAVAEPSYNHIQRSGGPGSYVYSAPADWQNRPIDQISWAKAARFANWLTNGQPTGVQDASTTEDGSYSLLGATTVAQLKTVTRKMNARYVIPTDAEWYKAAYHKADGASGNYWDYSTRSNAAPGNQVLPVDDGNSANYFIFGNAGTVGPPYYVTGVGEFEVSLSAYGSLDQGGNVGEWTETIDLVTSRAIRGGYYGSPNSVLKAGLRWAADPTVLTLGQGFRIAEVPEPSSLSIVAVGFALLLRRQPRSRVGLALQS